MKNTICFLFLLVVLAFAGATAANAQRCKITDPTGTPLNVRASPNGRIVGKVRNGTVVYIEANASDRNGKAWARIGTYRGRRYVILGWVFREFISCY
jgi:uncharacterized protein YgiM (DUF1202 family)